MTANNLYQSLYQAIKFANSEKSGEFVQKKTNELWSRLKNQAENDLELESITTTEIKKFKEQGTRQKSMFTSYFLEVSIFVLFRLVCMMNKQISKQTLIL